VNDDATFLTHRWLSSQQGLAPRTPERHVSRPGGCPRYSIDDRGPIALTRGTDDAFAPRVTTLCEKVPLSIDTIVMDWKRRTRHPPWTNLSESDWVDHLPPLLSAMIEGVVCGNGSQKSRRSVVEQGIQHGRHRYASGLSVDNILDEQAQLRSAMWRLLMTQTNNDIESDVFLEMVRFDVAIGVATLASVTGFHRSAAKQEQDWGSIIDRLLAEWEQATLMEASH
jgi:hypothetical protein